MPVFENKDGSIETDYEDLPEGWAQDPITRQDSPSLFGRDNPSPLAVFENKDGTTEEDYLPELPKTSRPKDLVFENKDGTIETEKPGETFNFQLATQPSPLPTVQMEAVPQGPTQRTQDRLAQAMQLDAEIKTLEPQLREAQFRGRMEAQSAETPSPWIPNGDPSRVGAVTMPKYLAESQLLEQEIAKKKQQLSFLNSDDAVARDYAADALDKIGGVTPADRAYEGAASIGKSFAQLPADIGKTGKTISEVVGLGLENAASEAAGVDPKLLPTEPDPNNYVTYGLGESSKAIEDTAENALPSQLALTGGFEQKGGQALGQAAGILAAGATMGPGAAFAAGGMQAFSQGYEEAKAAGRGDKDALLAGTAYAGIGMTDALPVLRMLENVAPASRSTLVRMITKGAEGAVTESIQETGQTIAENRAAQEFIDKNRGLMDGVIESGGYGGFAGSVLGMITGAARRGHSQPESLERATLTGIEQPTVEATIPPQVSEPQLPPEAIQVAEAPLAESVADVPETKFGNMPTTGDSSAVPRPQVEGLEEEFDADLADLLPDLQAAFAEPGLAENLKPRARLDLSAGRDELSSEEFESRVRDEYEQEAGQDDEYELLSTIRQLGGLPAKSSSKTENWSGELENIRQEAVGGKLVGQSGVFMGDLFRKDAPPIDQLRSTLSDYGFHFDTPAELLDAIHGRIRTGKPVYNTVRDEVPFSRRQKVDPGQGALDFAPNQFQLETQTPEQIKAEQVSSRQKNTIQNLINRDLKGDAGDLTADMFGEGDTPLFNERRDQLKFAKRESSINRDRLSELGTTTNFKEAGYLTPQGSLIDLSGKREGGQPGTRSYDHREAGGTSGMMEFIGEGNIRLSPESGGLDLATKPTPQQESVLRRWIESRDGEVVIDLATDIGEWNDRVEGYTNTPSTRKTYLEYPEGTKAVKIIGDIRRFYNGEQKEGLRFSKPTQKSVAQQKLAQLKQADIVSSSPNADEAIGELNSALEKVGETTVEVGGVLQSGGTNHSAKFAEKIAGLFGRKIVYVRGKAGKSIGFDGVILPGDPEHIFLADDSSIPAHIVTGHELLHHLRNENPDIYSSLVKAIRPLVKNYQDFVNRKVAIGYSNDADLMREEFLGDLLGDQMGDPAFWQEVADQMKPSVWKRFQKVVSDWLTKTIESVKALGGFGSEKYITDLQAARKALAQATANWAEMETSSQAKSKPALFSKSEVSSEKVASNHGQRVLDWINKNANNVKVSELENGKLDQLAVSSATKEALASKITTETSLSEAQAKAIAAAYFRLKERKFGKRVAEDKRLDPEVRDNLKDRLYEPISNDKTVNDANALISERGLESAVNAAFDPKTSLPPRVRVTVAQRAILEFNKQGRFQEAVDVAERAARFGTEAGQGVQAFAIWDRLTPEGFLLQWQRTLKEAHNEDDRKKKPRRKVPPGIAGEIVSDATDIQNTPEGFQREEKVLNLLEKMEQASGSKKLSELITSMLYASMLSGYTTQERNALGNLYNLVAAIGTSRPTEIATMLNGVLKGLRKGVIFGGAELSGVKGISRFGEKIGTPSVLERKFRPGLGGATIGGMLGSQVGSTIAGNTGAMAGGAAGAALGVIGYNPTNLYKYIFRIMSAADLVFYKAAEEGRARVLARREVGKSPGASIAVQLGLDQRKKAKLQAATEGLTGIRAALRAEEIMEQSRDSDLRTDAADFAKRVTFQHEPRGTLGQIAAGIDHAFRHMPLAKVFVVPFTRIVANVFNEAGNYVLPVAMKRAWKGYGFGKFQEDLSADQKYATMAKGMIGALSMFALYALDDDDDEGVQITANGPQDFKQRKQLMASGWKPYSIRVKDKWYSYKETPLAVALGLVGQWKDAQRYSSMDGKDLAWRTSFGMLRAANVISDMSFASNVADFADMVTGQGTPDGLERWAGKTGSMVVPNAVKQLDLLFDPTFKKAEGLAVFSSQIPSARHAMKPDLNVLGQPVQWSPNILWSKESTDPVWRYLSRNQIWISPPGAGTKIGERLATDAELYDMTKTTGPVIRQRVLEEVLGGELTGEDANQAVRDIVNDERDDWKFEAEVNDSTN